MSKIMYGSVGALIEQSIRATRPTVDHRSILSSRADRMITSLPPYGSREMADLSLALKANRIKPPVSDLEQQIG